MAEPSPAEAPEGQEPDGAEGQEPDGNGDPDSGQEPQGRTYTEAYVKQLRREAASLRNRLSDVEERLQVRDDADKTEQERLTERATAAEARAQEAEMRLLRLEVAAERGLDAKAIQFLTGSTREEIELRAEELGELLKDKPSRATAGFDGGARGTPAPPKGTPEQEHNDFLLRAMGRPPTSRGS
jgi:hypothetical protein